MSVSLRYYGRLAWSVEDPETSPLSCALYHICFSAGLELLFTT